MHSTAPASTSTDVATAAALLSSSSSSPTTAPTSTACPFRARFHRRLPRGFAAEADGMDWGTLIHTYAPSSDRFHLADLSRRPLGRGITAYEAILATRGADGSGFTAQRLTTESCGDLVAMSEMLSRIGAHVEIERFHQYEGEPFDDTGSWCTLLHVSCGLRQTWALGFGGTPSDASIAALLSGATLLHLR